MNYSAGQQVTAGDVVLTVLRQQIWVVEADVDQKKPSRIKPGQLALVSLDAYPQNKLEAELFYIAPQIDEQKGTCLLRLEIKNAKDTGHIPKHRRALGYYRKPARIFIIQGFSMGFVGALIGILLGLGIAGLFMFGTETSGGPAYELKITLTNILLPAVLAVLSASVATLVPARRAAGLNPMEVIRNG